MSILSLQVFQNYHLRVVIFFLLSGVRRGKWRGYTWYSETDISLSHMVVRNQTRGLVLGWRQKPEELRPWGYDLRRERREWDNGEGDEDVYTTLLQSGTPYSYGCAEAGVGLPKNPKHVSARSKRTLTNPMIVWSFLVGKKTFLKEKISNFSELSYSRS